MKKILLLLILIIAALSICACQKTKTAYGTEKDKAKNTGTQVSDENEALYNRFLNGNTYAYDKQGGKLKITDLSGGNSAEYAFYDINGDGKNELLIRNNFLYIFWIKDNTVTLWHEDLNYAKILSENTPARRVPAMPKNGRNVCF